MTFSHDPRPIDPPEYWDDEEDIDRECIVNDAHGIYIPQVFCERYKKLDCVTQEDWDICLSGPEHDLYWDAWNEILNDWRFEEADAMGNVFEIFLDQDGDLFQCRRFIRAEYSKKDLLLGID